jgi:hypothetical protein
MILTQTEPLTYNQETMLLYAFSSSVDGAAELRRNAHFHLDKKSLELYDALVAAAKLYAIEHKLI